VNDNLGWLIGMFNLEQTLDHFLFRRTGLAGIDLDYFSFVVAIKERIGFNQLEQLASMRCIASDYQNEVFSGSDLSQCLAAVNAGQVDVGMSDALETMKYAKAHPEVVDLFADQPYDLTPISWAVRQDDLAWKAFLDTALGTLEAQGKLAAFERKYDYRWVQPVTEYKKR